MTPLQAKLRSQLIRDEGKRNRMYPDSRGVATIGIGHNLRDVPISDSAIFQIFDDDLAAVEAELILNLPAWYATLSEARQGVLLNMAFNLGVEGLLRFTDTLAKIGAGDYAGAARAMLNSVWATQVGERARRLARQMETDSWI